MISMVGIDEAKQFIEDVEEPHVRRVENLPELNQPRLISANLDRVTLLSRKEIDALTHFLELTQQYGQMRKAGAGTVLDSHYPEGDEASEDVRYIDKFEETIYDIHKTRAKFLRCCNLTPLHPRGQFSFEKKHKNSA